MSDYGKLVAELNHCSNGIVQCDGCSYAGKTWDWGCESALMADAAAAIEELQAEAKKWESCTYNEQKEAFKILQRCRELEAELEPKRGEWIWIQKANGGQYKGCSVCHAPIPTDSMLDYLDDEDCEFCYSCGAKMEVQDDPR